MASAFLEKARNNSPGFVINVPEADRFRSKTLVSTLNNRRLLLPSDQVPTTSYKASNWWRYQSNSATSTLLSGGGPAIIKIDRGSGTGAAVSCYLRLVINNSTGAAAQLLPVPLLINNLSFQNGSGTVLQIIDGISWWLALMNSFDLDSWVRGTRSVMSDGVYDLGIPLANGETRELICEIPSCLFSASGFHINTVDSDMQLYVTFQPSTVGLISGSAPTLQTLTFDVKMTQETPQQLSQELTISRKMMHNYIYPYWRTQTWVQTLNASSNYNLQLTAIKGPVVGCFFQILNSTNGRDLLAPQMIQDFQFLDSGGQPISGNQVITAVQNRYINQVNYFPGQASYYHAHFAYVFGDQEHALLDLWSGGKVEGFYQFTTSETLSIDTGAAGVSEVVTVTPSATPASGTFIISWVTESNNAEFTAPLAYNATAATIKAAIEALNNFDGTITVSGPLTAAATFTFGGNYANKPMSSQGRNFTFITAASPAGGTPLVSFSPAVTTVGSYGITNGNTYTIVANFCQYGILQLNEKGQLETQLP
jgi:hypothetical protein